MKKSHTHRERIQRQLQMQQKRKENEELLFRVGPGVTGAHHVPDVSGAHTIATTPKEIKLLGKQKTHTTQTGIIIPLFSAVARKPFPFQVKRIRPGRKLKNPTQSRNL
jgi:hypothetical protein